MSSIKPHLQKLGACEVDGKRRRAPCEAGQHDAEAHIVRDQRVLAPPVIPRKHPRSLMSAGLGNELRRARRNTLFKGHDVTNPYQPQRARQSSLP